MELLSDPINLVYPLAIGAVLLLDCFFVAMRVDTLRKTEKVSEWKAVSPVAIFAIAMIVIIGGLATHGNKEGDNRLLFEREYGIQFVDTSDANIPTDGNRGSVIEHAYVGNEDEPSECYISVVDDSYRVLCDGEVIEPRS